MMKTKIMLLVFLLLVASICPAIVFSPESKVVYAYEMEFESKAALLMEYNTGEILTAYHEHERLFPASITKIMTVLLALEALDKGEISLTDEVPVTQRAASMGGSQIFLSAGDVVDMESLLIGMVVASGNDAAVAVAEYLAGSEEAFVEQMNKRAAELGMKNTNFVNSNGLHDDQHFTTAYDIALMSREIIGYPIYSKWSTIWMDENFLEGKIKSEKVYLSNTNRLIRDYQDCDGIKTGNTSESGHSISATAERNETRFIAVVLNAPTSDTRYEEARSLLNYGFANYYNVQLADKHETIKRVPVDKGTEKEIDVLTSENLSLLVKKGEEPQYTTEIVLPKRLNAPLSRDNKIGKIKVMQGEKVLKEVELEVSQNVEKASLFLLLKRYSEIWLKFGR